MTCREFAGAIICGPSATRVLLTKQLGERWCFICRKRREFTYTLTDEVEPSYYEPWPAIECSEGHHDGDCGFGRYREWGE